MNNKCSTVTICEILQNRGLSGIGIINHGNNTIKYNSNGSGIYITNPDGTVYQKGFIELKTGGANDRAIARYESKGRLAEESVLDNGVMFFNSSSPNGKLSFLNNRILAMGAGYIPALGGKIPMQSIVYGMKILAQNVTGITVPNSGHFIPEELPQFLADQLLKFFGNAK